MPAAPVPAPQPPAQAARVQDDLFKIAFEQTLVGTAFVATDGRLMRVNRALCELLGYSEAELRAKRFRDITHPDDVESSAIGLRRILTGETNAFQAEKRYLRKNGQMIWVRLSSTLVRDGRGQPLYFVLQMLDISDYKRLEEQIRQRDRTLAALNEANQDITEGKRVEEALRTREAQLSNAMKIAHMGYWEYDVASDTFAFNDQFYSLFRTTAEREGGYTMPSARYAQRFVHPDDAAVVGVEVQKAIETTDPNYSRQLEHRMIYADGEVGYISVRFFIVKDAQGHTVKTYGANQDITERKRVELERERLLVDVRRRAIQLQTASEVSHAASSILSLDELLRKTVELIRERFDLYYVGLFLVGKAREYAVLHAGTGEAGRLMLERAHRLAIDEHSMIGWCVANKKARIALDVGQEAVRFENPLLPETHSELALPLVTRGEIVGAMTVQSREVAAFSEQDIAVLQTMADQIANAIANTQLYQQVQAALTETRHLAQRERLAGVISNKIRAAVGVEDVLRIAVEELRQAMGSTRAVARLGAPAKVAGNGRDDASRDDTTAR